LPAQVHRRRNPAGRIVVKPNFVATDMGVGSGDGDFVLYVGRLSPEKGIHLLLDAWRASGRAGC